MKLANARPSLRILIALCLIASLLVLATGCASRTRIQSPPAADLALEPEPLLDPAAVINDSAAALDEYDIEHASWGRRGWDQVRRLRVWFCDVGVKRFCD